MILSGEKLSISAFFPAYNDAGTIASMVVTILLTLRELSDDYEVLVINDGSQDYTPQVLDELAREHGLSPAQMALAYVTGRPFLTANAGMWEFFEPELRRRLNDLADDATLGSKVRSALIELKKTNNR